MPDSHITGGNSKGVCGPFPRSVWTHPYSPADDLDRLCAEIWKRAEQTKKGVWSFLLDNNRLFSNDTTAETASGLERVVKPRDLDEVSLMIRREHQILLREHGTVAPSAPAPGDSCSHGDEMPACAKEADAAASGRKEEVQEEEEVMSQEEQQCRSIEKFLKGFLIQKKIVKKAPPLSEEDFPPLPSAAVPWDSPSGDRKQARGPAGAGAGVGAGARAGAGRASTRRPAAPSAKAPHWGPQDTAAPSAPHWAPQDPAAPSAPHWAPQDPAAPSKTPARGPGPAPASSAKDAPKDGLPCAAGVQTAWTSRPVQPVQPMPPSRPAQVDQPAARPPQTHQPGVQTPPWPKPPSTPHMGHFPSLQRPQGPPRRPPSQPARHQPNPHPHHYHQSLHHQNLHQQTLHHQSLHHQNLHHQTLHQQTLHHQSPMQAQPQQAPWPTPGPAHPATHQRPGPTQPVPQQIPTPQQQQHQQLPQQQHQQLPQRQHQQLPQQQHQQLPQQQQQFAQFPPLHTHFQQQQLPQQPPAPPQSCPPGVPLSPQHAAHQHPLLGMHNAYVTMAAASLHGAPPHNIRAPPGFSHPQMVNVPTAAQLAALVMPYGLLPQGCQGVPSVPLHMPQRPSEHPSMAGDGQPWHCLPLHSLSRLHS
ncbi:arginine-glutamic acid dipeptide repeats protein-like [Alosa alosa]|uniref:arginine-glutamic acid dipeptide repeats protein-like n=1 Tax=Alosa alosa TaxID=278164 RepID=UPI00201531BF|nr:arginine-glutamic acid dipeptide repeats protein-like [Alosa alosa]